MGAIGVIGVGVLALWMGVLELVDSLGVVVWLALAALCSLDGVVAFNLLASD